MPTRRSILASLAGCAAWHVVAAPASAQPGYLVPDGLVGDGAADETPAIRRALATGRPVLLPAGRFRVTGKLTLARAQTLSGISSRATSLLVTPDFPRSDAAVIDLEKGEPGGQLRDIGILFSQPENADRQGLIAYPPAVRAVDTPRFRVDRVLVQRATTGIDMRGNSGGAVITDLEISAFGKAIWIDGSRDSVKIARLHVWPFGLTPRQMATYRDGQAAGLVSGRCDDLHLENSLIFGLSRAASFERGASGGTFGSILGVDFDNQGGLWAEDANLRISACTFTVGEKPSQWIVGRGGSLDIVGCNFQSGLSSDRPGIDLSGDCAANLAACSFKSAGADLSHIQTHGPVRLTASGLQFAKRSQGPYRRPLIQLGAEGRAALTNIMATDVAPDAGTLIQAAPDAQLAVSNVIAPGWRMDIPRR